MTKIEKKIVVAGEGSAEKLAKRLEERGLSVLGPAPDRIIEYNGEESPVVMVLRRIKDFSWLVFTSRMGVDIFFETLYDHGFDIRRLHHLKIACIGEDTEKDLNKRGIQATYVSKKYNGKALAEGLISLVGDHEWLLLIRAKGCTDALPEFLEEKGLYYEDIAIYEEIFL